MIELIIVIIVGIVIIWAYHTPEGKNYKKFYIQKFGYWDTALCIVLLFAYNIWSYSVMGINGLLFPITLFFDIIFICAIVSSIVRVKRIRKKKNK